MFYFYPGYETKEVCWASEKDGAEISKLDKNISKNKKHALEKCTLVQNHALVTQYEMTFRNLYFFIES